MPDGKGSAVIGSPPLIGAARQRLLDVPRAPPPLMAPIPNVPYPAGLTDEELEKVVDYILTLR